MSFLNELISSVTDEELREQLQERVDIVVHKIKFMDKVPVVCLDTTNTPNLLLANELNLAGGIVETDILDAVYIIYYEPGKALNDLMREVPALIDPEWAAAKNGRIVLLNGDIDTSGGPSNVVVRVENFAEMLHPGSFVFGYEGDQWIRFGV